MTSTTDLFDLTGRVAVVTGASRGLGREMAPERGGEPHVHGGPR